METATRTACVVAGANPDAVSAIGGTNGIVVQPNRHGTLVTGRPGDRVIDYAHELGGPVYDVMYSAKTGWFSVTIFRGGGTPTRWDNRPDTDAGYPRIPDVMGATTPAGILDALDIPASAIGYADA